MNLFWKLLPMAAFLVGLAGVSPAIAAEKLIFASREKTITNRFAERVLSEAYSRLNIEIEFAIYPDARSVKEANEGRADGEVARLENVLKTYSNLRAVPVPLFYSELSAFVHNAYEIEISGWESLQNRSLTAVRGFEYIQSKLAGQSAKFTQTSAQAIKLVEDDLVEIAVLNRFLGLLAMAQVGAKYVKVYNPPLERLPVFHLLHKKHQALIPRLVVVLEQMRRAGELGKMWEDFSSREIQKSSQ